MTLPKWLSDIVSNLALPFIKSKGKTWVVDQLERQKNNDENLYRTEIIVGYRLLKVHGTQLAHKTSTEWDDDAVALVCDAIEESANALGCPLPDVTIIALPPAQPALP